MSDIVSIPFGTFPSEEISPMIGYMRTLANHFESTGVNHEDMLALRRWAGKLENLKDALECSELALGNQIDSACKVPPVIPTGEQLYTMVTSRFKSGSFPWAVVAESGKAAWSAAAADLLLSPGTILERYSQPSPSDFHA